ncbi:MAG TPA: hypothetical protein VJ953_16155 [Saprospiraceae bacterium]|nr:hypothetical protein [Saprospiraceae bacterium]
MSRCVHLYDAFTGMNSGEKMALVNFLRKHNPDQDSSIILDSIDYALKNKPSFGGFVFTCWENSRIVAAVLVNKTGMSGSQAPYQMVYANLCLQLQEEHTILEELIRKAIRHAKGEIGLHLKPDHPALPIFRALGFEEQYVELRFSSPQAVPARVSS